MVDVVVSSHDGSMVAWYIYLHGKPYTFSPNVGKDAMDPMDPMGLIGDDWCIFKKHSGKLEKN